MTFGMISIAETTTDIITLDTPIEELNDLTLNEVFRDGNMLINEWLEIGLSIVINNDVLELYNSSTETTTPYIYQFVDTLNTYTYYSRYEYFIYDDDIRQTYSRLGTASSDNGYVSSVPPEINQWVVGSHIKIKTSNDTVFRIYTSYILGSELDIHIKNTYLIDLTSLGIDNLTQQQLNNYYDLYINGGYYEYDAVLNDLDMTDFIIISSSFVLWLWFMRFVKGVL
jgi:hypothetical protein